MSNDKVIAFKNPAEKEVEDHMMAFIHKSAQKMLKTAIDVEVNEFLAQYGAQQLPNGQQRLVRNGYLPERNIQTPVGQLSVSVPRIRDRATNGKSSLQFSSNLVPKYMRRTVSLDVMLPLLYLKGISTKDFQDALVPLLGEGAKSITPNVIGRLKAGWYTEYKAYQKRDLSKKRYVYWWVDGVYLTARMETEKSCMLVIVGADEFGNKELVSFIDGFRESKASWLALLQELKQRGLHHTPKVAVGDGALGFWGAVSEAFPGTKHQRCWVHKTVNVLDKLPKSQKSKAKSMLHDIYLAATKQDAQKAWDDFINVYQLKYPKATNCLEKNKEQLLTFYHYPAEHWVHLRTTNPIESTFATVKHRTRKSKGCFSRETIVASVFKLMQEAQKRWKRLNGQHRIAEVINLVKFKDGIAEYELEKKNTNEKMEIASA